MCEYERERYSMSICGRGKGREKRRGREQLDVIFLPDTLVYTLISLNHRDQVRKACALYDKLTSGNK